MKSARACALLGEEHEQDGRVTVGLHINGQHVAHCPQRGTRMGYRWTRR